MQLILCTDIDIDMNNKMSSINEESLNEKDAGNNFVEKIMNEIENGNKENIEKKDNIITDCEEKDNQETNNFNTIMEDSTNENIVIEKKQITVEQNSNNNSLESVENPSTDIVIIDSKTDNKTVPEESVQITEKTIEEVEDKIINIPSVEENEQDQKEDSDVDLTNNIASLKETESLENNCKLDVVETENIIDEIDVSEKSPSIEESDEIIDLADDRPCDDSTKEHNTRVVENSVENAINFIENISDELETTKAVNSIRENDCSEIMEYADTDIVNLHENNLVQIDKVNEIHEINKNEPRKEPNVATIIEKKKLSLLSNLSNTLDILSDEDDNGDSRNENESQKELPPNKAPNSTDKQCINIEDDDIMVIDDEVAGKERKSVTEDEDNDVKPIIETKQNEDAIENSRIDCNINENQPLGNITNNDSGAVQADCNEPEIEEDKNDLVKKEKVEPHKPLLPVTLLKTCKKNLADMTRDELEEFCIIKIVESVVDRSNLGDIKLQLKTMSQNIEEYKNRTKMLTKQNRDLQVVLKSVQEEQKKNSGSAITPLKITRSVGIQVLMDKMPRKRSSVGFNSNTANNSNATNSTNCSQIKAQTNQLQANPPAKVMKTVNIQQIPVPRLVPAMNTNNAKNNSGSSPQTAGNSAKIQTTNNMPNGVKNAVLTPKPEKRSHGKMQQNSSFTVDLTDDEPPAKVLTRNANPSVRCVLPQNLLAPRPPLTQATNSPRKVYIPISGPQGHNVRPGQTIMLKSISPQNTRPRANAPNIKMLQNTNPTRRNRLPLKHPAPLPESMKQYQPPNWKALPPTPELKLSKVENGIVISWKIDGYQEENHEEIASYQLYAYQETSLTQPSTSLWKKIGDVKALPLPMACTLTQFMAGYKYYFAVRAVDVRSRYGSFSLPGSILLLSKV